MAINPNVRDHWKTVAVNSALAGAALGSLGLLGSRQRAVRYAVTGAVANLAVQTLLSQSKPRAWLGEGRYSKKEIGVEVLGYIRHWFADMGIMVFAGIAVHRILSRDKFTFGYLVKQANPSFKVWIIEDVLGPIGEEILFRGLLYDVCEGVRLRVTDDAEEYREISQAVQAILFGLAHPVISGNTNVGEALIKTMTTSYCGWVWEGQRRKWESLLPSMLCHGLHNTLCDFFYTRVFSIGS